MKHLIAVLALAATACTSTNFVKTGFDTPATGDITCPPVVLQEPPKDRKFVELGFCTTSTPGGGVITDKTPVAIRQLQQCACDNGGNAIVYAPESEAGVNSPFGYSQQRVKARATVLYVYPERP